MCQKETYLSNRVFNVSALFNRIADLVGDDASLGEVIASTLELSAVTNLKAFDGPMKKPGERNRDTQTYSFNGKPYARKPSLYTMWWPTTSHSTPTPPMNNLRRRSASNETWTRSSWTMHNMLHTIGPTGSVDFFGRKPDIPTIQLADRKIVIAANWPTQVNGKPAEFAKLLDLLRNKLGYDIKAN